MKRVDLAAILFAALPALAGPLAPPSHLEGPFQPVHVETALTEAAAACALFLRYDSNTPYLMEIRHVGGVCDATEVPAMLAATARTKVGGEPAHDPVYGCSTTVLWDPATAGQPEVMLAGSGCASAQLTALPLALQAIACLHDDSICRR